jgi:hypothetical protein
VPTVSGIPTLIIQRDAIKKAVSNCQKDSTQSPIARINCITSKIKNEAMDRPKILN